MTILFQSAHGQNIVELWLYVTASTRIILQQQEMTILSSQLQTKLIHVFTFDDTNPTAF
jgi:hypothetical protein